MITKLSSSAAVRDATLRHEPTLLHSIISRAVEAEDVQSGYSQAAVAMLSHPLPDTIALPAVTQTFFAHLVAHASRNPCVEAVKPVYSVLKGTSTTPFELLSNDTFSRFETQLIDVLRTSTSRTSNHAEDHSLTLYCLGIMKMVVSAADVPFRFSTSHSFYDTQELLASTQPTTPRWSADGMRKFFEGSAQAPKTIRLLVLRAVEACCVLPGVSSHEMSENLDLATEILHAVPLKFLDEWCRNNASIRNRLQQKALTMETDSSLQLRAVLFIWKLCKSESTANTLRQIVCNSEKGMGLPGMIVDGCLISGIVSALDAEGISSLLCNITKSLITATPEDIIATEKSTLSVLDHLTFSGLEDEAVRRAVCAFLPRFRAPEVLQTLTNMRARDHAAEQHSNGGFCYVAVANALQRVCSALSACLLQCALQAGQDAEQLSVKSTYAPIELHAASSAVPLECSNRCQTRKVLEEDAFNSGDEQCMSNTDDDWRAVIRGRMGRRAEAEADEVERVFARACATLEARCENIEQPLHEEQQLRATLQAQYDALYTAHGELEAHALDRRLYFEALEVEKDGLTTDLDCARAEAEQLLRQVRELETTLEESKVKADRDLNDMRYKCESADLQLASTIAQKAEQLDESNERLLVALSNAEDRQRAMQGLRDDLEIENVATVALKTENDHLHCSLSKTVEELEASENQSQQVTARNAVLEADLRSLNEALESEKSAHERSVDQIKEQSKQNAEAANTSCNDTMDRLAAQHGEEVSSLQHQLSSAHDELQLANERHSTEAEEHTNMSADMQKKVSLATT